jgi:hypothetical protein
MYSRYIKQKEVLKGPDSKNESLKKYGQILESAMNAKCGLQTVCD